MKYCVYILYSTKDGNLYVGCTSNLEKRLNLHNSGEVKATRFRRPLDLIHKEYFDSKTYAFNRERFLKSLWGAGEKQKIKDNFLRKN